LLIGLTFPDPGVYDYTGNPIFDFYRGIELYPRLGKYIPLKGLIIYRFGQILWALIGLIAWKANYELNIDYYIRGHINWSQTTNILLLILYCFRYYFWEDMYFRVIYIK